MVAKEERTAHGERHADDLVLRTQVLHHREEREHVGRTREQARRRVGGQPHRAADLGERLCQVAPDEVHHREGAAEHHADSARHLEGAEDVLFVGDDRIEPETSEQRRPHTREVLNNHEHEHNLERTFHHATEHDESLDHGVGLELEARRKCNADDDERDEVHADLSPRERQLIGSISVGGNDFAHHRMRNRNDGRGHKHADGDGQKATHHAEREVLAVALLEHLQRYGNGEHDGRASHVSRDHGHNPAFARLSERVGKLITAHIDGDECSRRHRGIRTDGRICRAEDRAHECGEIRRRRHDARDRQENRADRVDASDKLLPKLAFGLDDACQASGDRACHDNVNHDGSDKFHSLPFNQSREPAL